MCGGHHHYDHIPFSACFPLPMVGLFDKSFSKMSSRLRTILRVSRVHISSFFLSFSITSFHDFLGLPDLFCATTFRLLTSTIQPVLPSTCPNHLIMIILVRSTTSKSWMPSFVRRESELTSSYVLTLQIQWNIRQSPKFLICEISNS